MIHFLSLVCFSLILIGISSANEFTTPSPKMNRRHNRFIFNGERILRTPRKKQMNPKELLQILGENYNQRWMSIDKPKSLVLDSPSNVLPPPYSKLWTDLKTVNFTTFSTENISTNIIQEWLLTRASCPVRFVWQDVGPLFWPRWVRRGECVNNPLHPCSWPPGMHCVPAESSTIHVLRWVCTRRKNPDEEIVSLKCQWITVPYPVTNECFCSC